MAFGVPVTGTMAEDIFLSIFYTADTEGRLVYTLQRVTFPAAVKHGPAVTIEETYKVELQWLEHLWDYENLFETGVVRAIEGLL